MFTRLLFCLPLIASLFPALAQERLVQPASSADCCALRPQYSSIGIQFNSTVAVITQHRNQVLGIWDLENKNGAPLNTWWNPTSNPPANYFSDARWNTHNLGDVFGASLDGKGNIYVAATRIYGSANVGASALNGGITGVTGNADQKAGQIYRIATGTGAPEAFVQLPNNDGTGIGNIYYDCRLDSLYASNFSDGLIYRISGGATGTIQSIKWDHGTNLPSATDAAGNPLGRIAIPLTAKDGSSHYTALGRRVWAVTVHNNRLWYSIWNDNQLRNTGVRNEIWSVALGSTGDPTSPARLEISVPAYTTGPTFSNPVSDMRFGPTGTLMLAERVMTANNSSLAHTARALEYSFNGTAWTLSNPYAYQVGQSSSNSAGGVDFDFSSGGRVYVSGDALHLVSNPSGTSPPCIDCIYGIQGFPQGGGDITTSILIDSDNNNTQQAKTQVGVVRISCPDCTNPPSAPVLSGPQSTCVSPSHYSVAPQPGVTYAWTVLGGTPGSASGSDIDVSWSGGPGSVAVTTNGPGLCTAVSTSIKVAACKITCEFCSQFKNNLSMPPPVPFGGGGLHYVTPTVTSTMTGVTGVTTTLLNTSIDYLPASCGAAGPLASYIPQALPSSESSLNPPILPVTNGNQAIWQASAPVNLSGGVTIPFQIKLPVPPPADDECRARFSFCLRVSVANANCQNCDQIKCFGPFPYVGKKKVVAGEFGTPIPWPFVTFILPGANVMTLAVAQDSFLVPLLRFIEDKAGDRGATKRLVIDPVNFDPGNAVMDSSMATLNDLAFVLKAYLTTAVRLEGFTDNSGDTAANQRSSLARARAVQAVLQRAGVVADRVAVNGLGPANPIASNDTEEGRRKNNRIEIIVSK